MPFDPNLASLLSLYAGVLPSPAFLAFQTNALGQLEAYIQGVTGTPRELFSVNPASGNYDLQKITGANNTFRFSGVNGNVFFNSPSFTAGLSLTPPTGGMFNFNWQGNETGVSIYSYNSQGNPHFKTRYGDDLETRIEYNLYFGPSFNTQTIYGTPLNHELPGNMAVFCANAYDSTWKTSLNGASSSSADNADYLKTIGTTFCTWNGVGIAKRNFTIFPTYVELGGPQDTTDPYVEMNGDGAVVIRNTENPPQLGHPNGVSLFSESVGGNPNLKVIDEFGAQIVTLYPGIKNVDRIQLSNGAYRAITSTRSLTNDDNGKILYTNSTGNYLITVPNTLTKPFTVSVKSEGTGRITFTGGGGTTIRNAYGRYRTAGQWTVCGLDYRTGNDCVLFGDTSL